MPNTHPNATQLQAEPTNPVSLMAQQIATSESNSCFTEPANHVLPKLSAWTIPTTICAVPNFAISELALQGLSRAPNTNSDNAINPPVVSVTSGTVYYLNTSSGPNFVGAAMPINIYSTAPVSVPQTPKTTQVLEEMVLKHSNYLAQWLRKNFPQKILKKSDETKETTASSVIFVRNKAKESPGMLSVTNVKDLLQITEVNLQSSFHTEKVLVLCDSAFSNSWISKTLARKLNVQGTPLKITVHGLTHIKLLARKLKLTPVHSGDSCTAFVVNRTWGKT